MQKEPAVNVELALQHGLTEEEYERILLILGRTPTYTELGIFSVMWSEHCSYKNSIAVLKTLPRSGRHLLVSAGEENAGLVDIGDGLAVAFKIESHNHPSAVEPYQGAATGVGGIMRDIFTMGARPIASLDSLRFGSPHNGRVRYLLDGVVKGIGDYGNCFGVPTVAGEVYFDDSYQGNPIVNAMSVGVVRHDRVMRGVAKGEGNPVMIVGSFTGRDGIHGATFASEEISERSEAKRPSVQVGDPFTEKLLLEATLEAASSHCIVGIQDMGAAGITCSTSEMSARGESGMEIDLDKVPVRVGDMNAYEIMLSESQERMLVVAAAGYEDEVKAIFGKWDLSAEVIGRVTDDGMLRVKQGTHTVAEIPAESLVLGGGAPVYYRESKEPNYLKRLRDFDIYSIPEPEDYSETLLRLLSAPNIASKEWIFEQYDNMVRTSTVVLPGGDAAVVWIKGADKALAMKTDCNARYVYLNPRRGAEIAVAEVARNVVCTGGRPIAITNCLNFGNPYKPEVFWQFKEAVAGMGEACRVLETPVTGGNVSFYNEDPSGAIYPTPVIGMIGLVERLSYATTECFKNRGDVIALLGPLPGDPGIGGSEYLSHIHGIVAGDAPKLNLVTEKSVQEACLEAIESGIVNSAHDISDGGMAVALAECCLQSDGMLGASVRFGNFRVRTDFLLFGESQSRIILSISSMNVGRLQDIASAHSVPVNFIGEVEGDRLKIDDWVDLGVSEMRDCYKSTLGKIFENETL